jgi:hypothetical protein
MKKQLWSFLLVTVLFLSFGGITQAVDLPMGPFIFKTWNYEVNTVYSDGVPGTFYFRTPEASYHTAEFGLLAYNASDPNHLLFSDLAIYKDPSLKEDEDAFGLLDITQIFAGRLTGTASRFVGEDIVPIVGPPAWYPGGVGDDYLRGIFWGIQDQIVYCVRAGEYKIWSANGQFTIYDIDGDPAYNPSIDLNYSPAARPATPDEFPGWFDKAADTLDAAGVIEYIRFSGETSDPQLIDGQTEVLLSVTGGTWFDQGTFLDWWSIPAGGQSDIWQSWNIGDPFTYCNGWTGSEDSARGYLTPTVEVCECRVTGGGNDTYDAVTLVPLDDELAVAKSEDGWRYTFGGQAGSPTGCQPQPWGEWTHTHHSGENASFTFHAGTASAPEGTEIDWIQCSDPGWCIQARPAPAKQIDFKGVGTFKNTRIKNNSPFKWMKEDTLYEFAVHIEDLGEPGSTNTKKNPLLGTSDCPDDGRDGLGGELANCGCPDFYRITIVNPDGDDYVVYGYIEGGNLQIHPAHPCD